MDLYGDWYSWGNEYDDEWYSHDEDWTWEPESSGIPEPYIDGEG